jgi:hypothetical protein
MLVKAALAAAIAASSSPAVATDLRSYTVTVMENVRHEITVVAVEEYAARSAALLEVRRTSGSSKPWWQPSPPSVIAHARQSGDLSVIAVEPLPIRPGHQPGQFRLEKVAAP